MEFNSGHLRASAPALKHRHSVGGPGSYSLSWTVDFFVVTKKGVDLRHPSWFK